MTERLREAGRQVWKVPCEWQHLLPGRPDMHSVPTFCFILLTVLHLPGLEKAREKGYCALELIHFFQDRITLWL